MKLRIALLLAFCLGLAAVPAIAQQDLYDNGPGNGQDLGWTIDFGFAVANSFALSNSSTVNGLSFWDWVIPGDSLRTVEVQLGSAAFGNELLDVTVSLTASRCTGNQFGYNVCDETASFNPVNLNAGTYWMTLSNATDTEGQGVYWDMNSGVSQAQENTLGTIPSETFTILGSSGSTTTSTSTSTGTTPEPGSILLFGSGFFVLAGLLRRKLN